MEDKKFDEIVHSIEAFTKDEELQQDVKFQESINTTFLNLNASMQADVISKLHPKQRAKFLSFIAEDMDPELFQHLERPVLIDCAEILGNKLFGEMLSLLKVNTVVDILEEFSADAVNQILEFIQYKNRIKIKYLLSYPLDSVGRNMNMEFISIIKTFTVKDALEYITKDIKFKEKDAKNTEIFVIDEKGKVVGDVSIFDLIKFPQSGRIEDCLKPIKYIANTFDNAYEVGENFFVYDLQSVPVIDVNSKLCGVLELGNVVNFIKEEVEKDLLMSAGVFKARKEGILGNVKARFIWLFVNFLTASTAASTIRIFEPFLSSFTILATLMPIVASIGGNTGNQSSAIIIRSIAVKDFRVSLILREIATAFFSGMLFCIISFFLSFFLYHNLMLSISFSLAILINISIGGLFGSLMPAIIHRLRIDPASCSSIFVTMMTDMMGFFSFLGIAYLLLS